MKREVTRPTPQNLSHASGETGLCEDLLWGGIACDVHPRLSWGENDRRGRRALIRRARACRGPGLSVVIQTDPNGAHAMTSHRTAGATPLRNSQQSFQPSSHSTQVLVV